MAVVRPLMNRLFFRGSVISYSALIFTNVMLLEFVYSPMMEDWFYNSHNKGRQLSDILPQILKAEAAAAAAEDDDEEEEDDEE